MQGDSGGPLVHDGIVYAVNVYGHIKCNRPNVFLNTYEWLFWITYQIDTMHNRSTRFSH